RRARGEERESAPVERAAALEPPQFELPKPDQTMPPVAMAAPAGGTLRFDAEADAYLFTTTGAVYRVQVGSDAASRGLLVIDGRVGEGEWTPLLTAAGMLFRNGEGTVLAPVDGAALAPVRDFRHSARGRILTLRYVESFGGQTLRRTLVLRLLGRTL